MNRTIETRTLSRKERLARARLYCITCPPHGGTSVVQMAEAALAGGADILQLREKETASGRLLSLACEIRPLCRRSGALLIVNDRLDVALAAGADGVHLGQDDLPLLEARRILRAWQDSPDGKGAEDFLIGCSTHSLEQALSAEAAGADYIGCGPVFATPTKPGVPAVGLDLVRAYAGRVRIPFVAIGGIDESNAASVLAAGARCLAVVRSVCGSRSIEGAARALKQRIIQGGS